VTSAFVRITVSRMTTRTLSSVAPGRSPEAEQAGAAPACPPGGELAAQMSLKVAHELKNPLTAMKALVQLGLRNSAESSSHARLAILEKELARMQEILTRFMSVARPLEEVRLAHVDLGPLVSETLLLLSAQAADAHVRLLARGDATVEADPRRLKEALLNLVGNALEATPSGGEVVIEIHASEGHAEIVVHDTGRGMPPETLQSLGTPFFTTREDGTGLGVILARSVFALHGGSLGFRSAPGNGTTVTATLPTRPRPARSAATG
jgi:two-component system, NtrC family, sensor histidine kinase HydH